MHDVVFVVGAPRSGTTWVQQMLGAHPLIVTTQETDLFDGYLAHWRTTWEEQLRDDVDDWRSHRFKGLPAVLTQQAFDELVRDVVARVHDEILRLKPTAQIVLEKVPGYSLEANAILRTFPGARFVHVLRDGRDAVASMLRAAGGWGAWWAPSSAENAARLWRSHVEAGRRIAALTPHYVELRYEELRAARGADELARAFEFVGVDPAPAHEIYDRFAIEHAQGAAAPSSFVWGGEVRARIGDAPPEPEGFVGDGGVGRWRTALRPYDQLLVERAAGELLRELGYARDKWLSRGSRLAAVRYRARKVLA